MRKDCGKTEERLRKDCGKTKERLREDREKSKQSEKHRPAGKLPGGAFPKRRISALTR